MPCVESAVSGLAEVLRSHGVVRAVVIDDAFDIDIADSISAESCNTFDAEMKRNHQIAEELGKVGVDATAVLRKDTAALVTLAEKRDSLDMARPYVETLLNDYLEQRELLDDLVRHLKKLNLDVVELGANQRLPEGLQAQIAFIDFYLDDQVPAEIDKPRTDVDPSANARAKARAVYDQTRAFVFLMSSREQVSQEEAAFRKRAKLLRGYFQFQRKVALSNDQLLYDCLATIPLTAGFRHTLHDFVDCLDQSSRAIAETFVDHVRDLGLEDYAQLRQLSLNKDGQPFGDYIVRLFGQFMTSLILEDSELGKFILALDATTFESLLPIRAEPSAILGKIYLASLTEKLRMAIVEQAAVRRVDAVATAPRCGDAIADATIPAEGLLSLELGDLFVKDATSPIYAVMNSACDLALGPERKREGDDTVLLIPGSLRQLYESFVGTRPPTMFTPIYEMNGAVYRIDWDYRRLRAIPHKAVSAEILANGYRCERRLQLGPALELQQHFTSSISRVGLPVPPPIRHSHDASLYCRGQEGKWDVIAIPLKAAIIALHMRDKDEFIITTNAKEPAIDAIRAHVAFLNGASAVLSWTGTGSRAQYLRQLETSLGKWSGQLPFLHSPGSLPGGRDKEKTWNKKRIEIKDRLGVARDASVLNDVPQNVDAILIVDLAPMLLDQTAMTEEPTQEMEES